MCIKAKRTEKKKLILLNKNKYKSPSEIQQGIDNAKISMLRLYMPRKSY